jgi:hypothetical protein
MHGTWFFRLHSSFFTRSPDKLSNYKFSDCWAEIGKTGANASEIGKTGVIVSAVSAGIRRV